MDPADSLDTPILTAGTRGWTGVTNRLKAGLVEADQLTRLVNGRLDDTGSVQLRPGTDWLARPVAAPVTALAYFDVPGAEALLALTAGKIYELPADRQPLSPALVDGAVLASSGPYETTQLVDKLMVADGIRLLGLWRENGTWQTMQVTTFSDGSLLPPVQHVLAHGFRVFLCGGTGATADTIYASDLLDPFTISNTVGVRVGRGEGDSVVALRPGPQQRVLALKSGSCWWIDATGQPNEWTCDAISHEIGCWAGPTAVSVNQDLLFLSRRGVAQLSRLQNDAPVAPVDMVSAPIEATMARINWSAARLTACATLWREYYLLAVPLDGAHSNNAVLAYNTRTQKWCDEWTGWAPTYWCRSQFDGQQETILGLRSGDIVRLDETLTVDEGESTTAEIPLELETRAENFDAVDQLKIPAALDAEWRGSTATVDVSLRADGGSPQAIAEDFAATPEAGAANRRLLANLRELTGGRELQVRMVTAGGAFGLREFALKALPLRARWEAPPAELLVPPVPATDAGTGTVTLQNGQGQTLTLTLQEIDTITLDETGAFVCFRGGLTVPAGSYVIAYRKGSFTTRIAPEVSDLPAPTGLSATGAIESIAATWTAATDPRVIGYTVYVNGARHSDVTAPAFALAVPGGGAVTLAVFSRAADGTLSATAATATTAAASLPPVPDATTLNLPWMSVDDLSDYSVGEYDAINGGISWAGQPAISTYHEYATENTDAIGSYNVGEFDALNGGTNWAGPATSTIYT